MLSQSLAYLQVLLHHEAADQGVHLQKHVFFFAQSFEEAF